MSDQPPTEAREPIPEQGFGAFLRKARRFGEAALIVAERRRPAVEQAARDAADRVRAAAERARPHIEHAAQQAAAYAREHEPTIRAAAAEAASVTAHRIVPPPLRPALKAVEEELRRKPEPEEQHE